MNFNNILNMIAQNNINAEEVFALVEKIKTSNLKDEANLRNIIREVSRIAHKPIDKTKEDQLVKKIMNDGVDENLFSMF